MAYVREAFATGGPRDRETALHDVLRAMGHQRLSQNYREQLGGILRACVLRGILKNEGGYLSLECRSVADYRPEFLDQMLLANLNGHGRPART